MEEAGPSKRVLTSNTPDLYWLSVKEVEGSNPIRRIDSSNAAIFELRKSI
jgi:hypothetical protein